MTYTAKDLRVAMVDAAEARAQTIQRDYDPGQEATPDRIEEMLRDGDALFLVGDDGEYDHEAELEQCGVLVAASMNEVGDYLEPDTCVDARPKDGIVPDCVISTARLYYDQWWSKAYVDPPEHPDAHDIERGDVVCVGDGKEFGDHITIARTDVGPMGQIQTIEANAQNVEFVDGTHGEGLGFKTRHIDEVAIVHRFRRSYWTGDALED